MPNPVSGGVGNINLIKSPASNNMATQGYSDSDYTPLVSCNSPMIYQVQ